MKVLILILIFALPSLVKAAPGPTQDLARVHKYKQWRTTSELNFNTPKGLKYC